MGSIEAADLQPHSPESPFSDVTTFSPPGHFLTFQNRLFSPLYAIISNLTRAPHEQMMWRWYWKAWTGPTLVVGGQFGSLPLILPRFCPDQTILIIAFDPKHRFSHLLYSAIHIHSNLKRFPMATKKLPEGGKKPPCLRFSLPGGMDQRWGVIRSWGQPHGLVWDVIFREVFCVFFLWKEQLGEWGCAHCEAKGFTQGRRQNTKADKWVLRQNGKVDEQKQDKQHVQNQDRDIQKMKSGEDHGALGKSEEVKEKDILNLLAFFLRLTTGLSRRLKLLPVEAARLLLH